VSPDAVALVEVELDDVVEEVVEDDVMVPDPRDASDITETMPEP
jgi:hypothetical protein